MVKKGTLFVVSAPSGAGKTTLIRALMPKFKLSYSVSHTTRKPRSGEVGGKDYFFVDTDTFQSLIKQDLMLEWAKVHDHYYGTSRAFVEKILYNGDSLILDVDVQGARQIRTSGLNPVSVFIMPPSLTVLKERLERRETDTKEVIAVRLKNAEKEMAQSSDYDHVIVNDDLNEAIEQFSKVFAMVLEHDPSIEVK